MVGWRSPTPDLSSVDRYDELVAQRAKRVPLQHLTGTAAFGPVTVHVGPGVFIPRPETESLLEWAVAQPLSQHPGHRRPVHGLRRARAGAVEALARRPRHRRRRLRRRARLRPTQHRRNAGRTDPGRRHRSRGCSPNSTARWTSSSPTRPTFPTARSWNPKWPNMIRRTRCSAGRTGWPSSTRSSSWPPRWLRDGGRCAVEHDDTTSARTVEAFTRTGRFVDVTARHDLTGRPRFVTADARG